MSMRPDGSATHDPPLTAVIGQSKSTMSPTPRVAWGTTPSPTLDTVQVVSPVDRSHSLRTVYSVAKAVKVKLELEPP